jgi:hypothetical protein
MIEKRRPGSERRVGPRRGGEEGERPRRAAPRRQGPPAVVWLVLIGGPLLMILLVLLYKQTTRTKPPAVVETVQAANPNRELERLEKQVLSFQQGAREVNRLIRSEDPTAKQRVEALVDSINRWTDAWNGILDKLRDANGRLPAEYQGYESTRSAVNTIRSDLLKQQGF